MILVDLSIDKYPNSTLKSVSNNLLVIFHSREEIDADFSPYLILEPMRQANT